jgi:hypothetical protein
MKMGEKKNFSHQNGLGKKPWHQYKDFFVTCFYLKYEEIIEFLSLNLVDFRPFIMRALICAKIYIAILC